MSMKIKAIIVGSTGMVGKGVLLECLDHPDVESVLVINRRSIGIQHAKLKELIHKDFEDLSTIREQLAGYNACFYCLGVSVLGLNEQQYTKITYDFTKHFADVLNELNPEMVFNYVSGSGTDSTEAGKTMWARIKGKTENYVLNKGFKDAYMFRPGAIIPERGIKSRTGWYNFFYILMRPFFPLMKRMENVTTTTKIGKAMIHSVLVGADLKHLENKDINQLAKN